MYAMEVKRSAASFVPKFAVDVVFGKDAVG